MSAFPFRFSRRHLFAIAGSIAATVTALALMGRSWWCKGGRADLWWSDVESFHNSQHLFDPYTFSHVLHGVGFYALLWLLVGNRTSLGGRFAWAVVLESLWEVVENTSFVIERYRDATIALGYYGDSISNSMGDILACVVGFVLAAKLPTWASVVLFVLLEALLLVLIRDSLLLNIIMLLWPLQAIKSWQMGGG